MTKLILEGEFQKFSQNSYPYRIYSTELHMKWVKDYNMKRLAWERITKMNIITEN
jgi:hypothetical protein